ncbi:MAG TPA: hypothetical protein VN715_12410 [Roseiarcus sp.]|nr:hypothetical protein [Roseiarcus sp.]
MDARDDSLPPEAQRFMAARAKAPVAEVEASHASPVSRPDEVTAVILAAAHAAMKGEKLICGA